MGVTEQVERSLGAVIDPMTALSISRTGILAGVRPGRDDVIVSLALPTASWPVDGLREEVLRVAQGVPGTPRAQVETSMMSAAEREVLCRVLKASMGMTDAPGGEGTAPGPAFLRPGTRTRVLGVSSGKGGVGKSSVTVNLAIALAQRGQHVAVLDADVYGFSVPKMIGSDIDPVVLGDLVVPALAHGVRWLSMGFFVADDQPVIWRGPMLHKALGQFFTDTYWGTPDFLVVDMPPGTGDVALSLAQVIPMAEVIVVTTPQPAAQLVAQRSAYAARKLKLSVRGVVENMSWFSADDEKRYEIFGSGGGERLAAELGVPLLGQVPLVPALREGGDTGRPVTVWDPANEASAAFATLAARITDLGPARVYKRELLVH
ncbi:MAG: Mrp/NBP35 family ATP-binding protein [Acidimicrobiales bacterium]